MNPKTGQRPKTYLDTLKLDSIGDMIPDELQKTVRWIATIRDNATHLDGFEIDNIKNFSVACEKALDALDGLESLEIAERHVEKNEFSQYKKVLFVSLFINCFIIYLSVDSKFPFWPLIALTIIPSALLIIISEKFKEYPQRSIRRRLSTILLFLASINTINFFMISLFVVLNTAKIGSQGKRYAMRTVTFFRSRATGYQKGCNRTKKDNVRNSVSAMGIGLGATVLCLLGTFLFWVVLHQGYYMGLILLISALIAFLFGMYGVISLIIGAIRAEKTVRCPKCSADHKLYKNVSRYMCTGCNTLLILGKGIDSIPRFSSCYYCGLPTAVSADAGAFLCPNCGVVRDSSDREYESEAAECATCKKSLPRLAIYCRHCGSIQGVDFSVQAKSGKASFGYDEDWKIGKDGLGHFVFARALVKRVNDTTTGAAGLPELFSNLDAFSEAMVSMEEALQDADVQPDVLRFLPRMDVVYGDVLSKAFEIVQRESVDKARLNGKKRFEKGSLKRLASGSDYIAARRRMEAAVGDSLTSAGSIGVWADGLLVIRDAKELGGKGYCVIEDYAGLKKEMERFSNWKANSSSSPVPTPTSPPPIPTLTSPPTAFS